VSLSREAILAASDLEREEVPVDEWEPGATVWVRSLTGLELNIYHQALARNGAETNTFAGFLIFCIVDEAGERLFGDDDAELLGRKSAVMLSRLWIAAQRVNPLASASVEKARKN
jgi:hypothetical protein